MAELIVNNATIVTVNDKREILEDHSVVVRGNKIQEIGPSNLLKKKYRDTVKILNGRGKIIFPGLINTHNHLYQSLLKGLGDDLALSRWLATMTFPSSSHLLRENVYAGAMLGCVEGIKSGTTTMLDYMYPHPVPALSDGVVDAFRDLKIRGILARGMMNTGEEFGVQKAIMQDIETIEKDLYRLFDTYHGSENGRIEVWAAPAAVWSNSEDLLRLTWKISNEYKSGFTIHISETPFDRESSIRLHGVSDADVLEKYGIVGPNVLMVHCVFLTDRDIRRAKYYDLKVSHNTVSNMYLSSGVAPVPRMLESGITVGLGTDGAASNNSQDMIELLKFTALLHKVHTKDPTVITAEKVLEMATIDGAKAIGKEDEIGSIEEGKKADFFIYNPSLSAKSVPMHHPVSTLVYAGTHACVESVVIDGSPVLENGVLLTADESSVIERGQQSADDLAQRAGTEKNKRRIWKSTAF